MVLWDAAMLRHVKLFIGEQKSVTETDYRCPTFRKQNPQFGWAVDYNRAYEQGYWLQSHILLFIFC